MSVLIADHTFAVRKESLARYPGGIDALVNALKSLEAGPQFIFTADPHLLTFSFRNTLDLPAACAALRAGGLRGDEAGDDADWMIVDQVGGPVSEAHWLEWRKQSEELTCAWLAGTNAGDVMVPDGWVPRPSLPHAIMRTVIADVYLEVQAENVAVVREFFVSRGRLFREESNSFTSFVDVDGVRHMVMLRVQKNQTVCVCGFETPIRKQRRSALKRIVDRASKEQEWIEFEWRESDEPLVGFSVGRCRGAVTDSDVEELTGRTLDVSARIYEACAR